MINVVRQLLQSQVKVFMKNAEGYSALHVSSRFIVTIFTFGFFSIIILRVYINVIWCGYQRCCSDGYKILYSSCTNFYPNSCGTLKCSSIPQIAVDGRKASRTNKPNFVRLRDRLKYSSIGYLQSVW